jgi:hypothetical protein
MQVFVTRRRIYELTREVQVRGACLDNAGTSVSLREVVGNTSVPASPIARSVLSALAYADLFDYPLSLAELVRYQVGTQFSSEEIATALKGDLQLREGVSESCDGLFALRGRELVFGTRSERAGVSARVWRRARFYLRLLALFPFVRMIAVTGALAVDNIGERPDIDLLVVAVPGRVWLARRLIVAVVRWARLKGDDVCPNYIISEDNLGLDQRDLFTAHELAQMVPVYGQDVYRMMLRRNAWALEYLPAAFEMDRAVVKPAKVGPVRRGIEGLFGLRLFDGWEKWEMRRLQGKLRRQIGDVAEVICAPDQCKGHTGLHRHWVTTRYEQRLHELGLI